MSELPSGWTNTTLGELFDISIGRTPKRAEQRYWGQSHPWLSIADMGYGKPLSRTKEQITDEAVEDRQSGRLVTPGTVVASFKLSLGKVGVVEVPMFTNEAIAAFVPRRAETVDPSWLKHWFLATDLSTASNRAVMGGTLNKASLSATQVALPPLPEQRRIAALLDKAEDVHQKQSKAVSLQRQVTTSLGRELIQNAEQNIALGDILDRIDSGKSPVCQDRPAEPGEWGVLKLGAISSGTYLPQENKAIKPNTDPLPEHEVRPGDLLFSRKNTRELVGRTALIGDTPPSLMMPDLIFRLVLRDDAPVTPEYLHVALNSPRIHNRLVGISGGSAASMVNISKSRLMNFEIPVTPYETREKFSRQFRMIEQLVYRRANGSSEWGSAQKALQSRAFRGEL